MGMEILLGLLVLAVVYFVGLYVVRGFRSGLQAGLREGSSKSPTFDTETAESSTGSSH